MGANICLGAGEGVRPRMQWNGDRNAGFSRADQARLYSPPITDPVYGYQAVNVEAELRTQTSLLQWTKRLISVRKRYPVFGRGDTRFLSPENQKVLSFIRTFQGTNILVVSNLSRFVQPVELDLREYSGLVPIELIGETRFPAIGD